MIEYLQFAVEFVSRVLRLFFKSILRGKSQP